MTETLRNKVTGLYNELKFIVEKDPSAKVGMPTIRILQKLATRAKDDGGDAEMCDVILETLRLPAGATISASDAYVIAGQLYRVVNV